MAPPCLVLRRDSECVVGSGSFFGVIPVLVLLLAGSGPNSGLDSVDLVLGLDLGSIFGSSPAGVGFVFGSGPSSGFLSGSSRVFGPDSVLLGVVSGSGFWPRF